MEQPTENVKLSFEQLQAEDVAKKRLANLESEISIATRNLKILKGDTDRATKENIYQNEMLSTVCDQVIDKQNKATKLDEEILEKSAQLNQLLSECKGYGDKIISDKMSLKDREDTVSKREQEVIDKSKKIDENNQLLQSHIETHNKKVSKLKEVIATF